jgi:putative sterol carrier protein
VSREALFGPAWATALELELAGDDAWRRAAASWKGSLLMVATVDGTPGFAEERTLFLDLAHGNARAVRPALPGDPAAARFVLAAPTTTWIEVLEGDLEPASALMSGRVRLERGSLFSLLPHLEAARRLLACARNVGVGRSAAGEGA